MAWKMALSRTHGSNMNAFSSVVREIYSLRETLTKNFEVNSSNVTESNERTNKHTHGRVNDFFYYESKFKNLK